MHSPTSTTPSSVQIGEVAILLGPVRDLSHLRTLMERIGGIPGVGDVRERDLVGTYAIVGVRVSVPTSLPDALRAVLDTPIARCEAVPGGVLVELGAPPASPPPAFPTPPASPDPATAPPAEPAGDDPLTGELAVLRHAFDLAPDGQALISPAGRMTRANRALCRMLGRSEADLLRCSLQDISHPDDLARDLELLRETLDGRRDGYELQKRHLRADGHVVPTLLRVSAVRGADGGLGGLHVVVVELLG